jgi:hypothetical protein
MSPYLDLPVRSLGDACIELRGCRRQVRDCPACRLAELCPERAAGREDKPSVGRS